MRIANPIYDVVFKFMMNDNKVAKLLLSAIIGEEIIELVFEPTELPFSIDNSITVLRMDFKATVQYKDGKQQVIIIELQKAKLPSDIMRFRRYLGEQYQDKNNSEVTKVITVQNDIKIEQRKAFPILSIYFLGHSLDYADNIPVIKVARNYLDIATGDVLKKKEEFIEALTHDSYIIQIPFIKGRRRTELEKLLHIFDQSQKVSDGLAQFLEINEEEIPDRYQPVLKRLITAFADRKVRNMMYAEEELLGEMQSYARAIEDMKEAIEQKDKAIEQKDKALEKAILQFIQLNFTDEQIVNTLGVSSEMVKEIRTTN